MLPPVLLELIALIWTNADIKKAHVVDKHRLFELTAPLWMHIWWSWGESNPRPQAFFEQFYMCSRLIWVSLFTTRSGTLCKTPATLNLDVGQVARHTPSQMKLPRSLD